MKRKHLSILILFLCCTLSVNAQNMLNNQFGSSASGRSLGNRDRNGNPIDTTAVTDASTIPIGMYAWKVTKRLGNIVPVPVDTLQSGFQNSNDTGGPTGQYNYLGNLGSPRLSRIFFDRKEESQFFFTDPYDFSVLTPDEVTFTNTLSPFTNLTYHKSFSNRNSEERFKSYFAVNANAKLGFGFFVDYVYGRGMYNNQSTALFNTGLFASYRGDKYDMHFIFSYDNLKMRENGGITDDRYITDPLDMAEGKKQYNSTDIPTTLNRIWNHNRSYHTFLTHRYNLGFYKERTDSVSKDSVRTIQDFVPVTSFIHTLELDMNKRNYISQDHKQNLELFEHNYFGSDSTDVSKRTSFRNTFGISLREGFNKWAKAGLTAFLTHEYRDFALRDTTDSEKIVMKHYKENIVYLGGELLKEQGKTLHYKVLGEVAVAGEDAGNFRVEGNGDLNFKLLGDSVRLEANAFVKNLNPTFFYRHFHSKHYWWDNDDLSKEMRTRVEGKLHFDRLGTTLRAGVENIKNYTYLANTSVPVLNNDQQVTSYKNNATVKQHSGNIQVFTAMLQQKFKLGIFHLDGEVVYQKSSERDILPLPSLSAYGNLYIKAGLAKKVLQVELGADVRYFTKYDAPDYSPVIGQFYLQNPNNKISIGGCPIVNVYANLHLKRTRFYIMMYNINQSSGNSRYFLAPHYPANPKMLKAGLSWNFFD
ncbi:MAG: putative porin [Bacteroidaceae bacterium]|nr:putative porin [Bacteroidaceae bacterium]MBQ8888437.1 putative porin [Bacteroidaceae bacterium]